MNIYTNGLIFFDSQIHNLLSYEIWQIMKDDLELLL